MLDRHGRLRILQATVPHGRQVNRARACLDINAILDCSADDWYCESGNGNESKMTAPGGVVERCDRPGGDWLVQSNISHVFGGRFGDVLDQGAFAQTGPFARPWHPDPFCTRPPAGSPKGLAQKHGSEEIAIIMCGSCAVASFVQPGLASGAVQQARNLCFRAPSHQHMAGLVSTSQTESATPRVTR